ncbi:MAG: histidine triad nucleotide-binding protein [Planctomycetota bacterium]
MAYDEQNVFAKILRGEIPSDRVYEDERCIAFRDVHPVAPVHVLVIPRDPLENLGASEDSQTELLGHLMRVAAKVAELEGIRDAFRVVTNHGADAGQSVFHLHLHVLGGRDLGWPPG